MKITNKLLQKTFANVADEYNLETNFDKDHYKLDYNKHYGYEIVKVDGETKSESYPKWYPSYERMTGKEMYRYLQAMLKVKFAQREKEIS